MDYADEHADTDVAKVYDERQERQLSMLINRCRELAVAVSRVSNRRLSDKSLPADTRSVIIAEADDQIRQIYAMMDEIRAVIEQLKPS